MVVSSLFDEQAALDRMDGDRDLLRQIAGMFLAKAPAHLKNIEAAVIAGDTNEVSRLAHHLRGSLCTFASSEVTDAAQRLESTARTGNLPDTERASKNLESFVTRLLPDLRASDRS